MGDKQRVQYIDIYRGIGITLMVMGHVGIWGTYDYWIHGFHMPMFFFIAGYLYQDHADMRRYMISKVRTLLIPYLCYGLLAYIVYLVLGLGTVITPLIHLITINTTGLPIVGALWFLTALLLMYVIYLFVEHLTISCAAKTCIYYALAMIGCLETRIFPVRLPLALGPALVGVGMFHTARLIRDSKGLVHRAVNVSSPLILFAWMIVDTVCIMVSPEINLRNGSYPNVIMFWINAVSSSLLLLNLSRELWRRTGNCKLLRLLNQELEYIGRNSIVYVCMNQLVLYMLSYVWDISGYSLAVRSVIKLSRFLIAMLILRLWSVLVNRSWLRITIGK